MRVLIFTLLSKKRFVPDKMMDSSPDNATFSYTKQLLHCTTASHQRAVPNIWTPRNAPDRDGKVETDPWYGIIAVNQKRELSSRVPNLAFLVRRARRP